MALVPVVLRRRLLARANFVGGPLVNLLAFAVQPVGYLKRMSIVRGVNGSSSAWKIVAVVVYSGSTFKRIFGKTPEKISTEKVRANSFVNVINAKPMTKKQQRAAGITKADLKAQASADVAAAWAHKAAQKPKRKVVRRAEKTARMAAADRRVADKKAAKRAS